MEAWMGADVVRGGAQSDLIPVCRYGITNNMKIKKLSWPRESLASEFSEGPRCF